jgi:hypothetical protein
MTMDVLSPRKGKEKTKWVKVGVAWKNDDNIRVNLDALPLPNEDGTVSIFIKERTNVPQKDE